MVLNSDFQYPVIMVDMSVSVLQGGIYDKNIRVQGYFIIVGVYNNMTTFTVQVNVNQQLSRSVVSGGRQIFAGYIDEYLNGAVIQAVVDPGYENTLALIIT